MSKLGIRVGDEVTVVVYRNKVAIGEIVSYARSEVELVTSVTVSGEEDTVILHEALSAAASAVGFHMERPKLRKLLAKRIAELKDHANEGEDLPPYPVDVDDIPF